MSPDRFLPSLQELRSAVSDLFLGNWVQNDMRLLDSLRKPSKVRRRLARDSKPWNRVLQFLAQADQATDTMATIDHLLSAIEAMKGLPGISEGARFFVLSELIEASAQPRIEGLRSGIVRDGIVASEYRRSGEEAIAELFEGDRQEYERRLELGRSEFLSIRS